MMITCHHSSQPVLADANFFAHGLSQGILSDAVFAELRTALEGRPVATRREKPYTFWLQLDGAGGTVLIDKDGRKASVIGYKEGSHIHRLSGTASRERLNEILGVWLEAQRAHVARVAAEVASRLANGGELSEALFSKVRAALAVTPKSVHLDGAGNLILKAGGKRRITIVTQGEEALIHSETCSQGIGWVGTCINKTRAARTAREWLAVQPPTAQIEEEATVEVVKQPKTKKARAKKAKAAAEPTREVRAVQIGATLPEDEPGLTEVAAAAVAAFHVAVLASDDDAADVAQNTYEAAIFKLNGNTFVGSYGNKGVSAGYRIADYCAAEDGIIPMWGQKGRFILDTGAFRVLVDYKGFSSISCSFGHSFDFYALDLDRPFISETGFRADFTRLVGGKTVDQVARMAIDRIVAEKKGLCRIDDQGREWRQRDRAEEPAYQPGGWIAAQLAVPAQQAPAVPVAESVAADYLVCLEDGRKLKQLKRHLKTVYGLTPDEYRAKWRLPADYPMVAPTFSRQGQENPAAHVAEIVARLQVGPAPAGQIAAEAAPKKARKVNASSKPKAKAHSVITVSWRNPYTQPPADVDTIDGHVMWACTILDRAAEAEIRDAHAPAVAPGSGWCHGWSAILPEPKRWKPERKALARRNNLRKRLDKKFPLFADLFEAQEIERRPAYFDAAAIEAGADAGPVVDPFRPTPRRVRAPLPAPRFTQLDFLAQLDRTAQTSTQPARRLSAPTVASVARQLSRQAGRLVTAEELGQSPFDIIDPSRIPAALLRRPAPAGQGMRH